MRTSYFSLKKDKIKWLKMAERIISNKQSPFSTLLVTSSHQGYQTVPVCMRFFNLQYFTIFVRVRPFNYFLLKKFQPF